MSEEISNHLKNLSDPYIENPRPSLEIGEDEPQMYDYIIKVR
jgi:hypothetical protein